MAWMYYAGGEVDRRSRFIMNYFEWFDLPFSLKLDMDELKRRFYEKSKAFHPDFHTQLSPAEQLKVLESASLNNQAYKTLSNFDQRLKYALELQGALAPEGENKVPQDFLFEMMEYNESLMSLQIDPDRGKLHQLTEQLAVIDQELKDKVKPWLTVASLSDLDDQAWQSLADFYLKRKYLQRLRDNLDKVLD